MRSFKLPAFDIPVPVRSNPHFAAAGASARAWLRAAGLAGNRKLDAERYDELLAKMYPRAAEAELEVAICWLTWYFMMDDLLDKQDIATARHTLAGLAGLMQGGAKAAPRGPMETLWSRLWPRVAAGASAQSQRRFLRAQQAALLSNLEEIENRMEQRIPDLFSFVELRRLSGGMRPVFLFNEYASRIELPAAFELDPLHATLSDAANDVACICNDIISYDKEAACGETNNYVTIVQYHMNGGLQEAVDFLRHLQAARLACFRHGKARLPAACRRLRLSPAEQANAERYVEGIAEAIAGLLDWSLHTPRYLARPSNLQRSALVQAG